jgi:hypothetical protein
MQITKLVDSQVQTSIAATTAATINSATCIRLFNNTSGIVTVSVASSVGAATTNTFEMPPLSVEFLQKLSTDVVYTNPSIKVNKVGFTN